jgi:hypothetical protein
MLIVGELINASRKQIGTAIKNQDKDTIQQIAKEQSANGNRSPKSSRPTVPITLMLTRVCLWVKKQRI